MNLEEMYYPGEEPPDEAEVVSSAELDEPKPKPKRKPKPKPEPVEEAAPASEFPVALWRGRANYHCPYCRFASTKESAVRSHVATMHERGKKVTHE